MAEQLEPDFIEELFKACMRSRIMLEICIEHLSATYLPDDAERAIWTAMANHYQLTGTLPTLGSLAQEFSSKTAEKAVLSRVKQAAITPADTLLVTLEDYIRRSMFVTAYEASGVMYNKGDRDGAFAKWQEIADMMKSFTLKSKEFSKVFGDYSDREERRAIDSELNGGTTSQRFPFSIDELDAITYGGLVPGDTACFLAQSGQGKSKCLKWIGIGLARRGYKVLHIQGEGTKDECEALYDAGWSGVLLHDIETGGISEKKAKDLSRVVQNIQGEIYVVAFEQFDSASMSDIRKAVIDVEKAHGKMDAILVDYLELFDPGDGKKYGPAFERERRLATANKFKNICIEFMLAGFTATQASNVDRKLQNDGAFYMTRDNISEVKNLPNAFSFFITMNQTDDEYDEEIMRLYTDKIRKYKGRKLVYICLNFGRERFYDRKRTIKNYYSGNESITHNLVAIGDE